jgi:hypothetical protein
MVAHCRELRTPHEVVAMSTRRHLSARDSPIDTSSGLWWAAAGQFVASRRLSTN